MMFNPKGTIGRYQLDPSSPDCLFVLTYISNQFIQFVCESCGQQTHVRIIPSKVTDHPLELPEIDVGEYLSNNRIILNLHWSRGKKIAVELKEYNGRKSWITL